MGALCRYVLSQWLSGIRFFNLPIGTLTINLIGCFLLGLFTALGMHHSQFFHLSEAQSQALLLMLSVGFCGAFTTFSTFSGESIKTLEAGLVWQALLYVLISVGVGLLLFWWGKHLAG